jgi:hypothetical protein
VTAMSVVPTRRSAGRGRQPQLVEDLRDRRDELTAHQLEALDHVDRARPLARQLELALEAIVASDEGAAPLWRHLHNLAGGLVYELERYERRHLPEDPPAVAVQVAA